ncbi:MAG TPA: thiamine phosphate synthase [Xanthobacteraceae bacterium]|nr:thiamine phosphate synthase [Xanthobacteraceae bacterium]
MANRPKSPEPRRPAPRLYLVVPPSGDPAGLADALAQALHAVEVAAVLVSLTGDDERALLNGLKALAPAVQSAGAALVLEGRADLVGRAGADGAHLSGVEDLSAAVPSLKPDRIAGCGGLATRHDAMLAAEAGADYVMFGEPDENGHRPSFDAVIERVEWWAEVFQIPCVGFAAHPDEIAALVTAGADFVAVGQFIFDDPRGPAAAMKDAQALLSIPEAVE